MWELWRYNMRFLRKRFGQKLQNEAQKQTGNLWFPENAGLRFFGIDPCIMDFQTELNVWLEQQTMCLTSRRASYIAHVINISHIWLMAAEWCFLYHQWFYREFSAMGVTNHSFHCASKATSYNAFSFLSSSCILKAICRWKTKTLLGTHIPKGGKGWKHRIIMGETGKPLLTQKVILYHKKIPLETTYSHKNTLQQVI